MRFTFLKKPYRERLGERYEQIVWLTQRSIKQHRPAFKLVSRQGKSELAIRIHSNEKYPWRFPGAITERGALAVGDHALMDRDGHRMLAVVERRTLDNLLADFGMMPVLHQRIAELASQDNHALVIEASYADFLNPTRVYHCTPGFCARAIGELYALHPSLRIVFCANRKAANEWTLHFFRAIWGLNQGGNRNYTAPSDEKCI